MFRSIQFWTTVGVFILAPLCFGSVDIFWITVWVIMLSLSAMFGVSVPLEPRQRTILILFLLVCLIYGLIGFVQIVPGVLTALSDPIWTKTAEIYGIDSSPRISSRAEFPSLATGHTLLFVSAVTNGFFIGSSREDAERLYLIAQYFVLACAVYGLFAFLLTPDLLLWTAKSAYRDSLTGTFVNHNTAATFFGVGVILWLCSAFSAAQSIQLSSIKIFLLSQSNESQTFRFVIRSTGTLVCFFALLLTKSRGGLICSIIGFFVAIIVMIAGIWKPRMRYLAIFGSGALLVTILMTSRLGRIGSQGIFDDARWLVYSYCIEAIHQRPLLGSGIGTFADIFPSLRTTDLASWGVWDYAHSTILEIGVEMGIPIALLVVVSALAASAILVYRATIAKAQDRRLLSAVAGISALSFSHSLIDFSMQIPGYFVVFGVLLGCGLARSTARFTQKHHKGKSPSKVSGFTSTQIS